MTKLLHSQFLNDFSEEDLCVNLTSSQLKIQLALPSTLLKTSWVIGVSFLEGSERTSFISFDFNSFLWQWGAKGISKHTVHVTGIHR